mmetsp:Transcript_22510/g.29216  ORF Transcript_22510/g.29216 Transcript_22510/m.29216 type:complete len:136 (+) Transcript_22510:90-497(+)
MILRHKTYTTTKYSILIYLFQNKDEIQTNNDKAPQAKGRHPKHSIFLLDPNHSTEQRKICNHQTTNSELYLQQQKTRKKSSGKNARLIDDIVISDVSSSAAKRNHAFNNSVSIANPFFSSAYHFQRVFFKCPSCN